MRVGHALRLRARSWSWSLMVGALTLSLTLVGAVPQGMAGSGGSMFFAPNTRSVPQQLVHDTLRGEADGTVSKRADELQDLWRKFRDLPAARWYAGFVQQEKEWVPFEDLARWTNRNRSNAAYERKRDRTMRGNETIAMHLEMANWCAVNRQVDREQLHLRRMLTINPEHEEARLRLHFVRKNGQWVSQLEEMKAHQIAEERAIAFAQWEPRLIALRRKMGSNSSANRYVTAAELTPTNTPHAVAIMEAVFFNPPDHRSVAVLNAWAEMKMPEAAEALARQAAFSSSEEVRTQAVKLLRNQPRAASVPFLLGQLQNPWKLESFVAEPNTNGTLLETEVRQRPGMTADEQQRREILYRGSAWLARVSNDQISQLRARRVAKLQADNAQLAARNASVRNVLSEMIALEDKDPLRQGEPQAWWDWWNDEQDITPSTRRFVRQQTARFVKEVGPQQLAAARLTSRETQELPAVDFDLGQNQFEMLEEPFWGPGRSGSCECFVAGTPVWTEHGPLAIERVRAGDRVLAQDVETGALTLKVVEDTTVRPAEPILRLAFDKQFLRSTRGHLYWLAGRGWTMASELKVGDRLYTARGTVSVTDVQLISPEQTFNLVVADVATYFVGPDAVLSHDVTAQRPTTMIAPGVPRKLVNK